MQNIEMRHLPFVKEIVYAEVAIADECLDELRLVSVVSKIRTSDNQISLPQAPRSRLAPPHGSPLDRLHPLSLSPSIGLTSSQVWAKVKFGP
jgi:hypothetical protein